MPCFSTVEAVCRGFFYLTVGRGAKSLPIDIFASKQLQNMSTDSKFVELTLDVLFLYLYIYAYVPF